MSETVNKQTGAISQLPDITGTGELQVSTTATAVMQEIQGAILLAKHYPRDYQASWQKLMDACKRKTLAISAGYAFPRGGKQITGPSVNLARVAAQCYGNIRTGLDVLRNDEDTMHIRAWAWDIENNVKVSLDDIFKKLIYRKTTGWTVPDERDLRELVFRRGAVLKRNCIFECMPRDLIEDAMGVCAKTIKKNIKDPKGEAKKIILELGDFNITVEQIRSYVGHSNDWTADDIVLLQGVVASIRDGNSKASDYFIQTKTEGTMESFDKAENGLSDDDMEKGDPKTHQGFEDQGTERKGSGETSLKEEMEKGGARVEPEQEPPNKDDLIISIAGLENTKDYGETSRKDLRMEQVGQLELSSLDINALTEYENHLESLPDKGKGEKF